MLRKLIPLLALAAACSSPPPQNAPLAVPDRSNEVEAAMQAYAAALKVSEPDSVVAFYTADGELEITGLPLMRGRPAIRGFLAPLAAAMEVDSVTITTDDVVMHADTAAEQRGAYVQIAGPHGQPRSQHSGRYEAVWRREGDGRWRLVRMTMQPDPT